MSQIFQLTLFQLILKNPSSKIQFRPELKHQEEQMQHPANISRSILDSSNKVDATQNKSTIDTYRRQLFFPKKGTTEARVIGDSVANRNEGMKIGPNLLAIGFGVHKISGLIERTVNTRAKKVRQITILNRMNDCLSVGFDTKESVTAYKKLIYTCAHKFAPKTLSICNLLSLDAFRKESNVSFNKFNKQLCIIVSKVKDIPTQNLTRSIWSVPNNTHVLFRKDRFQKDKKKGRGVVLFVPKILAQKERPDLMRFEKKVFESVWVEFKQSCQKIAKNFYRRTYNNVKYLKTTSRKIFRRIVIQVCKNATLYMYWVTVTAIV